MNCNGCGTQLTDNPSPEMVNQAVDEVMQASVEDAKRRAGVCPLCGHSHYLPFYARQAFQTAVLVAILIGVGLILAVNMYLRSPIRTSLAQEAIARATQDSRVTSVLGSPVRAGRLASGGIKTDETGWSEGELKIPLSGPLGSAVLHVVAGRGDGAWLISTLDVTLEKEAQPVNLLRGKIEISGEQSYLNIHTQPAVTPEMLDVVSAAPKSDGAYPVIRAGMGLLPGSESAVSSKDYQSSRISHFVDAREDVSEVDLRTGVFVLRRTDLMIDDSIPLVFTRVFHTVGAPIYEAPGNWAFLPGDNHPAFGLGSSHTYDICPMGTRNPYTFMDLVMADGNSIHFERISKGTGYGDAWYEQQKVSSEFYKARLWWNGSGWTARLQDGTTYLFPESYNGTNLAQGSPIEMRNPEGKRAQLLRDGQRNLRRLVSPSGRTISLEYNDKGLIRQAHDDAGHQVDYTYDSMMRLILVTDSNGSKIRYTFDPARPDKMTTIESGDGRILLRNAYDSFGRVSEQVFADGSRYEYAYVADRQRHVKQAVVTTPDGKKQSFNMEDGAQASTSPTL